MTRAWPGLSRYFIKSFMQHDWSFKATADVYAPVWVFLCPQVQKGPTLGLLRHYIKQLSSSGSSRILRSLLAQVCCIACSFNCLKNACQKISSFKLEALLSSAQDPAPFQASGCTFFEAKPSSIPGTMMSFALIDFPMTFRGWCHLKLYMPQKRLVYDFNDWVRTLGW